MWKDLKYLIAYIAPLAAFLGIYWQGAWSFGSIYVGFVLIPFFELFLPGTDQNFSPEEASNRSHNRLFDWLLYLNIPILYGLLWYYFATISRTPLQPYELLGLTLNVGLIIGTIGINVAHELGHRTNKPEQFLSKTLLLSALYMHFFIEHNRGHHKHVATPEDPATSRRGETIYAFWLRSVTGSYRNAWRLEFERLRRLGLPLWSWHHEMIRFSIAQTAYLLFVGWYFGWTILPFAIAAAVVGFLLLESVNYIEHYGLRRKVLPSGRYEAVSPRHSWNSDHELGRIFLYELTRHSDHHYKATRKYQVLRSMEASPQLPCGYPAAILLSFLPPLWFQLMDKEVRRHNAGSLVAE
ncbi:MAG: alkane 1-monooxygenase [Phaeodactylibacter sp.]|nr:alkane 1-monooxygenase [Phaeodactylibacter sp.]